MLGDPQDREYLGTLDILYVEDDAESRELTGDFLRRRAKSLLVAVDGVEGLASFKTARPQLVVTDILMPRKDGLEMAAEIRRLDPQAQIVVTTAFERSDYLSRSLEIGIDQYVLKPIQSERLEFALLTCARRLRKREEEPPGAALDPEERERLERLTAREIQVLACLGRGLPSAEISQCLGISQSTVNTHLAHMMLKLEVHKATALATLAVRAGLLAPGAVAFQGNVDPQEPGTPGRS